MKPIIAAFDFDKTITTKDTLIPFLYELHSDYQNLIKTLKLLPTFLAYQSKLLDNHYAKEKLLMTFLNNFSYMELQEKAEIFAKEKLPLYLKPEAISRLRWHQNQNHHCILISAGLEIYLKPWAETYGFTHILATQLKVNAGKINGEINGSNCFGQEKLNRLLKTIGLRENFVLYAYGDSRGDKELLEAADYKFYRHFPDET
jgi:phosphatidylglycerophosphatase C